MHVAGASPERDSPRAALALLSWRVNLAVVIVLFALSVLAWHSTIQEAVSMRGMVMGLGHIGWLAQGDMSAGVFLAMWVTMMVAMMLPAILPVLVRLRAASAALTAAGYFSVWTLAGMTIYPLGLGLAFAEMRFPAIARAVPLAMGLVVILAGLLQFTAWKQQKLACCRLAPARVAVATANAWHHGIRLGLHCVACCAGPTAILLVIGVMDLRAMLLVSLAIFLERHGPQSQHIARVIGVIAVISGLWLVGSVAL